MTTSVFLNKHECDLKYDSEDDFHRIGLIVLSSDLTSEHDFFTMCDDPQVRIHVSRTYYNNPVTRANLKAMEDGLASSAELLDPGINFDVIYFSCTSASAVLGDGEVERRIGAVKGNIPVITPLTAATSALEALAVSKLSILTPYTADVAESVGKYFYQHGFSVSNTNYLGLEDDRDMARITPESIVEAAKSSVAPEAEALFISCTALRSAQVADQIEKETGVPVVTSNQGAAWRAMQLAGLTPENRKYGKIWTLL